MFINNCRSNKYGQCSDPVTNLERCQGTCEYFDPTSNDVYSHNFDCELSKVIRDYLKEKSAKRF